MVGGRKRKRPSACLHNIARIWAEFEASWNDLADFGPTLAKRGPVLTKLGQSSSKPRPNLGSFGLILSEFGPGCGNFGPVDPRRERIRMILAHHRVKDVPNKLSCYSCHC